MRVPAVSRVGGLAGALLTASFDSRCWILLNPLVNYSSASVALTSTLHFSGASGPTTGASTHTVAHACAHRRTHSNAHALTQVRTCHTHAVNNTQPHTHTHMHSCTYGRACTCWHAGFFLLIFSSLCFIHFFWTILFFFFWSTHYFSEITDVCN